ncbi:hypothetical protein LNV47_22575 [Paucibacter sp. DJ4R-1]|nr:hypothetical protein [Paucibacter sp. DJ4R-1]
MMKKLFVLPLAAAMVAALGGCAMKADPARAAKLQEATASAPRCTGEKDCAAKWDAAQLWVVKNAGFKIQNATNVLIQTYFPTNASMALGVEVTKEGEGGGVHVIRARIWCDNFIGCERDPLDAVLDFNRKVASAQP